MHQRIERREMLKQSGGMLLGAAAWQGATWGTQAKAVEPIARTGTPKFKFSLAAYSYRELLTAKQGQPAKLTLHDFLRDCASFQLDGAELTSYYFPEAPTNEYLCDLKQSAFKLGLSISGTAVRNDFCLPPGAARDKEIAHVKRWVDYSALLDAPVIRIFSGNTGKGQDPAEAKKLAIEAMEECSHYAGRQGVTLALENHGGLTQTVDGMLELVHAVRSPWFAVNLDSGNFHGESVYEDLAKIAPYAMNVQIKVVVKKQPGKKEPSDLKRLASMMRDVGYRGFIVLEYEEPGDPREKSREHLAELRTAFA